MTDEQRQQITNLRKTGYGYKKISQVLGVPENTIKSFCRRKNLGGIAVRGKKESGICKYCGIAVEQHVGRKTKKFCSDYCRMKWWNSHLDQVQRKATYNYICPVCKKAFSVYGNANRKYCSHACYIEDRFGGGR